MDVGLQKTKQSTEIKKSISDTVGVATKRVGLISPLPDTQN